MAAKSRKLRAVAPDEEAPAKRAPKTIAEAANSGEYRAMLELTMMRLAKALDDPNTSPRDLASNSRRFLETARELQALDDRAAEEAREDAETTPDDEWEAV